MNFTVIIPHYNSADLLERLLKSIPMDNDFQVIVVDDNSIVEEYEKVTQLLDKYSFELYPNEGKTAGGARNTGLKYAKGKWILFADADDYFVTDLTLIVDKYLSSTIDIIYFPVESRYSSSNELAYRDTHIKNIISNYKKSKDENYLRCCYTAPWGKLYRKEFLLQNDCKFEEIISGNDIMFSVKSGVQAECISYDDTVLYCITVSEGSITKIKKIDYNESRLMAYLRVNDFLRKHKLMKYQIAMVGIVLQSYRYGFKYFIHVIRVCMNHNTNFFFGLFDFSRYVNFYKHRNH